MGRSAASFECQSQFQVIEKGFDAQYYRLIIANDRLAGVQLINRIEHVGLLASTMWRKDTLAGLRTLVQNEKLLSMNPWLSALSLYIGK
jgi:hypothetical protein